MILYTLNKKRCHLSFSQARKEIEELSKLNAQQYIDMYYGDASHFSLIPNISYAWQTKNDPVLLPSLRGKSTSVFGLMNTLGNLVYDFF